MPNPDDTRRADRLRQQREVKRAAQTGGPDDIEVAALGYDSETSGAPKVLAHGRGLAAEKILELAKEYAIPLRQDPTLVSILGALDVGAEVPPDLYGVIAEVLAWAYHTDKQAAESSDMRRRRAA